MLIDMWRYVDKKIAVETDRQIDRQIEGFRFPYVNERDKMEQTCACRLALLRCG